jgi:hypothetical protein
MNESVTPLLELAIPNPKRKIIGAIVFASFLVFFIALAIYNLFHARAIITSSIWLLLVGFILCGFCKELGGKHVAINILGAFSIKESIQTVPRKDGPNEIQFGYYFFGFRFLYLKIAVDKITQVNWQTGQTSARLGKDAGDWSVGLWYEHRDPEKSKRQHRMRNPEQEVHIVGPEASKEKAAAFGLAFVDFLRSSGASLVRGGDDCHFVRSGS